MSANELEQLKTLGTLLNYNGYGSTLEDLYFPPAALYQRLQPHQSPFTFINEDDAFMTLSDGYASDHTRAVSINPERSNDQIAILHSAQ